MCGPHRRFAPLLPRTLRRILQAVGTITIDYDDEEGAGFHIQYQYRKR